MEDDEVFHIVNEFDQLTKDTTDALDILPRVIYSYIQTLDSFEDCRNIWKTVVDENNELSIQLFAAHDNIRQLQSQMHDVRMLIDEEKKKRKRAEDDVKFYKSIIDQLGDNLNKSQSKMHQVLSMLNTKCPSHDMFKMLQNNKSELETTGSFMTNLSYTRDEDDFVDISSSTNIDHMITEKLVDINKNNKDKKKRSLSAVRTCELKTKHSKNLVGTEVVTFVHNIHGTAVLESKLQLENQESYVTDKLTPKANCPSSYINMRPHNFQQKAMLKSEMCNVCAKRLRFSAMGYKCRDCKTTCHVICKDNTPLPCIPIGNTPSKTAEKIISDYVPVLPPMIPSLIVHCIKEVEKRGLTTVGLYHIPGPDKDVKALKEKFLRGKGVPNLSQIQEVHIICGCLKDFFRSLRDPLTTRIRWGDFARTVEIEDVTERTKNLSQIISELPQPNRDTLAFLILHLQKVAESPICKMPVSNLANAFAPTIIGYSSTNPENVYGETRIGEKIMTQLLELPEDYWESFICEKDSKNPLASPYFEKFDLKFKSIINFIPFKVKEEDQIL